MLDNFLEHWNPYNYGGIEMEIYYFWLVLFSISAYLIVTDESVAKLVYFMSKLIKFQYEKYKWWILHNPANPLVRYIMWRNAIKMAKQLEKDLKKDL